MTALAANFLLVSVLGWGTTAEAKPPLAVGDQYLVLSREKLSGYLHLPPDSSGKRETFTIRDGLAEVRYRERVLQLDGSGQADCVARVYDKVESRRKLKDQEQEATLRPAVRTVILFRTRNFEEPFSPLGPLQWNEIDLISTHVFVPALFRLLPPQTEDRQTPRVDDSWPIEGLVTAEILGLNRIDGGTLRCKYLGTYDKPEPDGKTQRLGQIEITGTVDGPSQMFATRTRVFGAAYYVLATGVFQSISIQADREILDKPAGTPIGRLQVDYSLLIKPETQIDELTPSVLGGLPTQKPSPRELALEYTHPGMGITVVHPRPWSLVAAKDGQLNFVLAGSSVLINVEPENNVPTLEAYRREVADYLTKSGMSHQPLGLADEQQRGEDGRVARFRFQATIKSAPIVLEYWIVARGKRGVTIAARLDGTDLASLSRDVEFMALGLTFSKPLLAIAPGDRMTAPKGESPYQKSPLR